jgi:hypothetical protein
MRPACQPRANCFPQVILDITIWQLAGSEFFGHGLADIIIFGLGGAGLFHLCNPAAELGDAVSDAVGVDTSLSLGDPRAAELAREHFKSNLKDTVQLGTPHCAWRRIDSFVVGVATQEPRGRSELDLLGEGQGIVDLNPEMADRVLNLRMSEK